MATKLSQLWDEIVTPENIELAVVGALRNKGRTPSIIRFMERRDELTKKIRTDLVNGDFHTGNYAIKNITYPKPREIHILPFYPDRIVHHALINVVGPIWDKMFIHDSYSCRVGRGVHAACRRVMHFVRKNRYFLQCDIRKFYPSINHDIMYEIIRKSFRANENTESQLLDVFRDIIYSMPGGVGMPIGNLTSQWMGNLYMNEMDRYVKDVLHARSYVRYCDDFVLFSDDKAQLRAWRDKIHEFIADKLKLEFSYAEIAPVSNGVEFCGYRHFPHTILLRRSTLRRFRARIKKINKIDMETRRADAHVRGQIASMNGWIKHCHSDLKVPKIQPKEAN